MPPILCTQTLWRRLGNPERMPLRVAEYGFHGVSLGAWATKVFRYGRHDLVITLDERTYATLLFPLAPRRSFRANFAGALGALLEDVHVPANVITRECAALQHAPIARLQGGVLSDTLAALQHAPIARLQGGVLSDTLAHAQYLCELDLADVSDLRHIQRHVNEYPHARAPAACAIEALTMLFAGEGKFAAGVNHSR